MEIKVLKLADQDYPLLLRETQNPPEEISIRGELPDRDRLWLAVVGTRKATAEGLALAKKIAKTFAERGAVIVSGLAMGIDTAAHEGALSAKTASGELGRTVAVLGCSVDRIYPAQNENLANKILSGHGAIVSEYEPGTPPLPHRFLERNRIVAGLAQAVIVVEAPEKSGALVTARLAAEYGREVFVLPGSAGHPQYRGSHKLIRDGARLVDSAEDIFEDLVGALPGRLEFKEAAAGGSARELFSAENYGKSDVKLKRGSKEAGPKASSVGVQTAEEKIIFSLLVATRDALPIDKILEQTKLPPQAAHGALTEMILAGIIDEDGFGYKLITDDD